MFYFIYFIVLIKHFACSLLDGFLAFTAKQTLVFDFLSVSL